VKRLGADQYLTKRDELRRTMGFQSGCPVVLFVGRLSPEKGLGTLIKATAICKARGLPAKLVLVGSGPEEDALRDLGQTTDMDVEFHGFLEGHALAERYAAADVFVLPSNSEPWGLVVNEAMEFGLPLLLSNRVGSRAVLLEEGNNGFTFPAGDENALADALEPLLARPEIQKEMGQASRLIIENCTIDQWADAVVRAVSPRPSQP
jgi:glycosyltransferase involved in cell wall biosynthesis